MHRPALVALVALGLACGPKAAPPPPGPTHGAAQKPAPPAPQPPPPKKAKPEPVDPLSRAPSSTARPGTLIAEVTAPDIDKLTGALRGYASSTGVPDLAAWDPGIRDMARELAGVRQLEIDWSSPIALFVFPDGNAPPKTVLASWGADKPRNVEPPKRVHREGTVWLIGATETIDAVRGYASGRAIQSGPAELVMYPGAIWQAYQDTYQMLMNMAPPNGSGEREMIDALVTVFRDSKRAVATLDARGSTVEVSFALEPRAGSGMARFGGAQTPQDHALFDHLPGGDWSVVASGRLRVDKDLAARLDKLSAAAAPIDDPEDVDILARQLWDVLADRAGRFAWAGNLARGGSEIVELIELSDANGAEAVLDRFIAETEDEWKSSTALGRQAKPSRRITGAKVRAMTIKQLKAKRVRPWWFRYGTTAGYVFAAGGKRSNRTVRQLIDAARRAAAKKPARPGKVPAGVRSALADSRQRRESMVIWLDFAGLGSFMGKKVPPSVARKSKTSGVTLGLGLTASSVGMRVTVPADQLTVLTHLAP